MQAKKIEARETHDAFEADFTAAEMPVAVSLDTPFLRVFFVVICDPAGVLLSACSGLR
jgi:hypothetical protein